MRRGGGVETQAVDQPVESNMAAERRQFRINHTEQKPWTLVVEGLLQPAERAFEVS